MSYRNTRTTRQLSGMEKLLAQEANAQHNLTERAAFLQRQTRREQRARYERAHRTHPRHVSQNTYNKRGSWMEERDRQISMQRYTPARSNPPVTKPKSTGPAISKNAFAMLDSDSDSDSDSDTEKKVATPALPSQKTAQQINNSATTWAGFRAKPPTKPTVLKKRAHDSEPVTTNWAKQSDSSSDEEEMEYHDRWDSD
jgi:hypothetical protein